MTRHLTPVPRPLTAHATLNDVVNEVGDHKNECSERRRKFAMWAIGAGIAAAGVLATVGIFLAKFLIVGAITLELDRKFPQLRLAQRPTPSMLFPHAAASVEMPRIEDPK